eukprot:jgi/Galph1/5003/GphlegSOOS_G3683.1
MSDPTSRHFPEEPQSGNLTTGYVVDDKSVPEGHKSLHEALYSKGEKEHDAEDTAAAIKFRSDGNKLFPVDLFLTATGKEKVAGVYAVYDSNQTVQFIGLSRDVAFALKAHRTVLPKSSVAWLKLKTFDFPRRSEMERTQEAWIKEFGFVPIGNDSSSEESKLWVKSIKDAVRVASAEVDSTRLQTYEEKKYKLRKAIADPLLIDEESSSIFERDSTMHAVSEDDWSQVIDSQHKQMTDSGKRVSPFANRDQEDKEGKWTQRKDGKVTVESVDLALNEVRPLLQGDGGNVKVLSVDKDNNVTLLLQGACGSCPSSTVTMKMGIERLLRQKFASIGEIRAETNAADRATNMPTKEYCESVLNEIRPAVVGLGGSIEVTEISGNQVCLVYCGPEKIKYGIELALQDKLGPRTTIKFV